MCVRVALPCLLSVLIGLSVAPALAADLGGAPDIVYDPPQIPQPYASPWYVGGRLGGAFTSDSEFGAFGDDVVARYAQPGFFGSAMFGYDMATLPGTSGFRIEGELAYLRSNVDRLDVGGSVAEGAAVDGDARAWVGLVNAYYDIPMSTGLSVFLGGGLGVANLALDDHSASGSGLLMDDSSSAFAWHLTSGVSVALGSSTELELGYRYLNLDGAELTATDGTTTTVDSTDHLVFMGLRQRF